MSGELPGDKRVELRIYLDILDWDEKRGEGGDWVRSFQDMKQAGINAYISAEEMAYAEFDPVAAVREEFHRKGGAMLEELLGVNERGSIHRAFRELIRLWPSDRPFPYHVMEM